MEIGLDAAHLVTQIRFRELLHTIVLAGHEGDGLDYSLLLTAERAFLPTRALPRGYFHETSRRSASRSAAHDRIS